LWIIIFGGFWLKRNQVAFFMLILLGILGGFYCLTTQKRQDLKRFAYLLFSFSTILIFLMLYASFGVGKRAILVHATGFYQLPAYSATYQSEIFAPGSVLEIIAEQDIWYKIAANGREYWVPKFRTRVL
jgi:hypothetical protein